MTAIIPFTFESSEIRVVDVNGEPWFVAKDVAVMLGYANTVDAIGRHCKRAQPIENIIKNIGGRETLPLQNQTLMIPEGDVNRLINRSKLPKAEAIQDWLCDEVMPSIRRTGGYQLKPLTPAEQLLAIVQLSVDQERRLGAVETKADRALELAKIAEAKHQASTLPSQDYSVMAWGNLQGFKLPLRIANMLGRRCAAMSKLKGVPMGETPDPRFGLVNTYMAEILEEVFEAYDEETRS
jgi:prophage antirepressor-like protein